MITVDFRRLKIRPGTRLLDVGCGSGRHMAEAYGFKDVAVTGVDRSTADLARARERLALHRQWGAHDGGCWSVAAADIARLPFADEYFDRIICAEVLEHIPNDVRAIREILRVLKPEGILAVSVPRFWPEQICWWLSPAYRTEPGGHVRIYRRRDLIRRFQGAGAQWLSRHYAHGLHSPFWWLKCLVGLSQDHHPLVRFYHRFLVWDLMAQPPLTRRLEAWLNPVLGKSEVLYFRKNLI